MGDSYLGARLEALRSGQNSDGGWGYFPRKQSWLEPTAYALLATHGRPEHAGAVAKAWSLVKSWQRKDGSFRPAPDVDVSCWATALVVTLWIARGELDAGFDRAVGWLAGTAGNESTWLRRTVVRLSGADTGRDLRWQGWPWIPGTASWVEPTAHTLVALKKASALVEDDRLAQRIAHGERDILGVRCRDGGWNYGNRSVYRVDLPSYPETTAVALLGLQGWNPTDLAGAIQAAERLASGPVSPLARAWLAIVLRVYGINLPEQPPREPSSDLLLVALEALGAAGGNFGLFRTGAGV